MTADSRKGKLHPGGIYMYSAFEKICRDYAENKDFSGTCMVKSGKEILFSGAYGCANRAFQIPNRIDTKFDSASVTKTFTAAAILQLVEKGLLRLDGHITDILDLQGTRISDDVRIEHLLSHTSGISDDADEESGEEYSALFRDTPNYAFRECRDFLKNFAYKEPYFKAGTDVRYNNCAFILLGLALEKMTGINYRTYMARNIFAPCGMTNTEFCSMDGINANTAEGYTGVFDSEGRRTGWKKNIYCYPPVGTPDGGACTTVEDLDKFLRAIRERRILSERYSDMLLSPHCTFSRPTVRKGLPDMTVRMGYAFEFLEMNGEVFCMYKEGLNDGVGAMFSYYPQADITVSLLANQDCRIFLMYRELQEEVYRMFYSGCKRNECIT